nr:CTD small phosphatase-like protein [Tanacetum cinerariifolium]
VVLDLDETLVCAYETSSLPHSVGKQATDAGLTWFELECVSSYREYNGKPKISYVTVFEHPGLHEFLAQLSKFADLVLLTAGLEGYARPLVDRIDAKTVAANVQICILVVDQTLNTAVLISILTSRLLSAVSFCGLLHNGWVGSKWVSAINGLWSRWVIWEQVNGSGSDGYRL